LLFGKELAVVPRLVIPDVTSLIVNSANPTFWFFFWRKVSKPLLR